MDAQQWASAMRALAAIGFEYGPFFFAILFILVIPKSAGKLYSSAKASSDDKFTYRNYFYASWAFGMVLVVAAVLWWMRAQLITHYAFTGAIVSLAPNQSMAPVADDQNVLYRRWPHTDPRDKMSDFLFVFLLDHPLYQTETFRFNYWEIVPGSGALGDSLPPPTAMIEIPVSDPTHFSQKYMLKKTGTKIQVVPFE